MRVPLRLAHAPSSALVLLLLVGTPAPGAAQDAWFFEPRPYFDPLLAGVRDAQVSALFPALADRIAFLVEDRDRRLVWDIDLGAEIPLFGWEWPESAGDGMLPPRGLGIGFWIPISFHMIEDFADPSAPIINTDYRFGAMFKLRYAMSATSAIGLRVWGGHESTHLGDEFSITAQRELPATFERINVSWEYLDVALLYQFAGAALYEVRGGVTTTLPFGDTYYGTDAESITSSPLGPVTGSRHSLDPHIGLEIQRELGGEGWRNQTPYLSLEMRWRSVYDYHKTDEQAREDRQLSANLIVGTKKTGTGGGLGHASPFARLYHGVNPHGQFRNQRHYTQFGLGLRLAR